MVQLVILPKMLSRNQFKDKSAILTITSETEFVSRIQKGAGFPVFRGSTSFTQDLTESLREAYRHTGIDVMHCESPLVSFECPWSSKIAAMVPNLVLQVMMEERLLERHVKSVLAQMCSGYTSSFGSSSDYLAASKLGTVFSTRSAYHRR